MKKAVIVMAAVCFCVCAMEVQAELSTAFNIEPVRSASGDHLFDTTSFLRLGRGDMTWSGALNLSTPLGAEDNATTINFYGSVGYFATDQLEVEASLLWHSADSSGASDSTTGARIALGANWYFGEWTDNVFPYVGAGLATGFADLDYGTRLLAKVGVRHYMNRNMGIRYWAELDTSSEEIEDGFGTISFYIGIFANSH